MVSNEKKILLFGGGRWSRQIINETLWLNENYIVDVISPSNYVNMNNWVKENNYIKKVSVLNNLPNLKKKYFASIIANSVENHIESAKIVIKHQIPTLIEKPVALNSYETEHIIKEAEKCNTNVYTSNVFLFSENIKKFLDLIDLDSDFTEVTITWEDPDEEIRYGELKKSNATIPVYADYLPHVCSLLWMINRSNQFIFKSCTISNNASDAKIKFISNNLQCIVNLNRKALKRKRLLEIKNNKNNFLLDFNDSSQVRVFINDIENKTFNSELNDKPLAMMIKTFLECSKTKKIDKRLDINHALQINKLIDKINKFNFVE